MSKTILVSAAVTGVLTTAIGAGVIRATSDSGSVAPPVGEITAADTVTTTDSSVQPASFDAAAPAAVEVDMQADETPAPPPSPTPATPEEAGNSVHVGFSHEFIYEVPGNTFANSEVTGKEWWRTNLLNLPDETGAPVIGSRVTLNTELDFDEVEPDKLTRMGPPAYEWHLGDVVEEPEREGWGWDGFVGFYRSPTRFSPGVDFSRSFDKTVFTSPGTQVMTVTLTPREEWVEEVTIFVHTDEDDIVDPVIESISHAGDGEVNIMEDGHRSEVYRIPVELDTPLTITYTLQVTPKVDRVEFWPSPSVLVYSPGKLASVTSSGDSVSYTNEAGTWTWTAEGDYEWRGTAETPDYSVDFPQRVEELVADQTRPTPPPTTPGSLPEPDQAITWPIVIGIVVAVVVAGGATYFLIWRRLKKRRTIG